MSDPKVWEAVIDMMAEKILENGKPDLLLGIESRGFVLSAPLAIKLGCGFAMVRKKGKLPGNVVSYEYDLEYGSDVIELQEDAIKKGQKVFILDDLLATGGTLAASVELVKKVGGEVAGAGCIIELDFLKGRDKVSAPVISLVNYDE
jgi:adenine phosphoribosyltransferase